MACLVGTVSAQITVNASAGAGDRALYSSITGAALPEGSQVAIGYFADGFDVFANAADPLALSMAWVQLGTTRVRTIFGHPGSFAATWGNSDPSFDGKRIWIFVITAGSEYCVFSSDASNWIFPPVDSLPLENVTMITSAEVNTIAWGQLRPSRIGTVRVPCPPPRGPLPVRPVPRQ